MKKRKRHATKKPTSGSYNICHLLHNFPWNDDSSTDTPGKFCPCEPLRTFFEREETCRGYRSPRSDEDVHNSSYIFYVCWDLMPTTSTQDCPVRLITFLHSHPPVVWFFSSLCTNFFRNFKLEPEFEPGTFCPWSVRVIAWCGRCEKVVVLDGIVGIFLFHEVVPTFLQVVMFHSFLATTPTASLSDFTAALMAITGKNKINETHTHTD